MSKIVKLKFKEGQWFFPNEGESIYDRSIVLYFDEGLSVCLTKDVLKIIIEAHEATYDPGSSMSEGFALPKPK